MARRRPKPLTDEDRAFYAGFVSVPLPVRYVARVAVLNHDRTWHEVEWRCPNSIRESIERDVMVRHPHAVAAHVLGVEELERP